MTWRWFRIDPVTAVESQVPSWVHGGWYTWVYVIKDADRGKGIQARVFFLDDHGNTETLRGPLLPIPAPPNNVATGTPVITGTAQVGETLSVDLSGVSDDDDIATSTLTYLWYANDGADDTAIEGATGSTYTPVADDEGKTITVQVIFTDGFGYNEVVTSAPKAAVTGATENTDRGAHTETVGGETIKVDSNTPATGLPTITGAAQVGETLTAGITGISDGDGLYNATFTYQWLADDAEINGATDSSYTLVAADAGKAIKVKVSFTDDAGNDEQLTSAATGAVAAAPPPPNSPATGLPSITGTAQGGETLTAGVTGISDGDGLNNAAFAYQWLAADAEINGATASSYTLVAADAGKVIKVKVSFTDDAGNDEELTSAATGAVAAAVAAVVNPPLTASAQNVPSSHDGSATFIFELRFSEELVSDFSYVTMRDHVLTVTGGGGGGLGDLCASAGAAQQYRVGDPRYAGLRRLLDHRTARDRGLRRPGRHVHRGRQDAVQLDGAHGQRARPVAGNKKK